MTDEFWIKVDKDTVIPDGNYIVILRGEGIDVMTFSNLTNVWTEFVGNNDFYDIKRHAKGNVMYYARIPDLPTPDLKCCPFCGSWSAFSSSNRVFCEDCGCSGPEGESELEAIELWNERCE